MKTLFSQDKVSRYCDQSNLSGSTTSPKQLVASTFYPRRYEYYKSNDIQYKDIFIGSPQEKETSVEQTESINSKSKIPLRVRPSSIITNYDKLQTEQKQMRVNSPLLKYNPNVPRGPDNAVKVPSPFMRYRAYLEAQKLENSPYAKD